MSEEVTIVPATVADVPELERLLEASQLPTAGVADHWRTFVVARRGDQLVGCGGAEAYPSTALIRSIAVAPGFRGGGLGRRLVRQLLDRLSARGIRDFYVLTTTAEAYFVRRGFRKIDRDQVSLEVLGSQEFQGACPSTAVCMRLVMLP